MMITDKTNNRLKDKVCLVTGGVSGIGAATARLFAQEGAIVMITGRAEAGLRDIVATIQHDGGQAVYAIHDVSSEGDWKKAVGSLVKQFGRIDVLVNNAGVTGDLFAPLQDRTAGEFMRVLSTNLLGPFLGI